MLDMSITIGEPICSRHLDVTELKRMRKREVCIGPRQQAAPEASASGRQKGGSIVQLNENTPGVQEYVLAMKFIRMLTPDGANPFEYWGEQLRNI